VSFHKGDIVNVTVRRFMSGDVGDFNAEVMSYGCGELHVVPEDWDEACDLLQREGSMRWTEIRDARNVGFLDAVPEEDVTLVSAAGVSKDQVRTDVFEFVGEMFPSLAAAYEMKSGDIGPDLDHEIESALDHLAELAYTWYVANA
jgi:hypothetical protein